MSTRILPLRAAVIGALFAAASAGPLASQTRLSTPQLSPHAQLTHTVGLTEISVDYHAPAVRGREIFGGKVPFDVVWRAGANENTTISFSHDVTIEGEQLAAGIYGLHMLPGRDSWVIIFNHDSEGWGSYAYSAEKDALRVSVTPLTRAHRERLAYQFDHVGETDATLTMHWADTAVPIQIDVDVAAVVLASAREAVRTGESAGWQFWFQAGDFGRDKGVDSAETMDWTDRSIAARRTFSNLWLRSELLADEGDIDAAGKAREDALQLVNLDELQDLGYRYVLRGDLENAVVVFEMVLSMNPTSWWPYVQLGDAKKQLGDEAGAIEALRAALGKNPDPVTQGEIEASLSSLGAS